MSGRSIKPYLTLARQKFRASWASVARASSSIHGHHPFQGRQADEGGMRAPMVIRWPGVIKPDTVSNGMFASLDWLPTFVNIAGGPKGDGLKKQIEAGQYPGIVKTTLDGVDQRDFLEGKSKSARDTFFYYSGKDPSAVRYKNWKMYFAMVSDSPEGFISGVATYHWTQVINLRRDPFETAIGKNAKIRLPLGITTKSVFVFTRPGSTAEDAVRYGRRPCGTGHSLCV
jgi:arylsulfatase